MKKPVTKVLFVTNIDKESGRSYLTAVFPEVPDTPNPMTMTCYEHNGGHSGAHENWLIETKSAKLDSPEVIALRDELQKVCRYKLQVVRRKRSDDLRRWYYIRADALGHLTPLGG